MADDSDADDDGTAEAGPGLPKDDDGLLKRLKRWERLARNHWSDWREEAMLCFDFVAGHQWSSDDKAALLDQMRQPVTFNRIGPMVDAVSGAEILNRQEVRFSPRSEGDVQVNEIITAADTWARELSDTEDEESDLFYDSLVCGMGWSETRMDYSDDPEGRLVDDRVDALEMWSDPQARKRNLADRRYHVRGRKREKSDLPKAWQKKLPSSNNEDGGAGNIDQVDSGYNGPRSDYDNDIARAKDGDNDKRLVYIRHFQWFEKESVWRVADPLSGQVITADKAKLKELGEMMMSQGMRPPKAVKIEQNKFYEAFVCGNVILETGPIEANKFTLNCVTGKRDRNKNTFFGVVRSMIDPQMWGNKFFVQIMHIINTSAKGGLMYETDSFANPRKALEDWAKPNAALEVKRGALANGAIQERESKNYPQGIDRLMEFVFNSMPQTSGINLEMLGLVQRDQPGVLEAQRKKAGYAILAVFFDSLRRYRKMKGRLRLFYIQNYMSDGRLIKIKGKDSTEKYIPLVKQADTATYDVIVDEAPMSPNQKEATWQMLMGLMPLLSKMNVPPEMWSVIIEHSPLPSAVSGKINAIISEQAQQPPPPDPEVEKAKMEMQMLQQKAQLDAQGQQQSLMIDQQKAQMDADAQQQALQVEEQKAQLEIQKAQIGLQIKQRELEIDMAKGQQQMQLEQEKMQLERQKLQMTSQDRNEEFEAKRKDRELRASQAKEKGEQDTKRAGIDTDLISTIKTLAEVAAAPTELMRDSSGKLTGARKATKGKN
jgi:hypothetical protein